MANKLLAGLQNTSMWVGYSLKCFSYFAGCEKGQHKLPSPQYEQCRAQKGFVQNFNCLEILPTLQPRSLTPRRSAMGPSHSSNIGLHYSVQVTDTGLVNVKMIFHIYHYSRPSGH